MPRKVQFSRQMYIDAAIDMIREGGVNSISARTLGARLGSSSRPLFTAFKNMDDVMLKVRHAAMEQYMLHIDEAMSYIPAYHMICVHTILFAQKEPQLFLYLFADPTHEPDIEGLQEQCESVIERDYGVSMEQACEIYKHMWYYVLGLGVSEAHNPTLSEEEIGTLLHQFFLAVKAQLKKE